MSTIVPVPGALDDAAGLAASLAASSRVGGGGADWRLGATGAGGVTGRNWLTDEMAEGRAS